MLAFSLRLHNCGYDSQLQIKLLSSSALHCNTDNMYQ